MVFASSSWAEDYDISLMARQMLPYNVELDIAFMLPKDQLDKYVRKPLAGDSSGNPMVMQEGRLRIWSIPVSRRPDGLGKAPTILLREDLYSYIVHPLRHGPFVEFKRSLTTRDVKVQAILILPGGTGPTIVNSVGAFFPSEILRRHPRVVVLMNGATNPVDHILEDWVKVLSLVRNPRLKDFTISLVDRGQEDLMLRTLARELADIAIASGHVKGTDFEHFYRSLFEEKELVAGGGAPLVLTAFKTVNPSHVEALRSPPESPRGVEGLVEVIREAAKDAARVVSLDAQRVMKEACYFARVVLMVPKGMNRGINNMVAAELQNLARRGLAELGFAGSMVAGVTVIPRGFPPMVFVDLGVAELRAFDLVIDSYRDYLKRHTPGTLTGIGARGGVVDRLRKVLGRVRRMLDELDPADARRIIWGHLVDVVDEVSSRYEAHQHEACTE